MTRQLAFDLGEFAPPSFSNYRLGRNAEALSALLAVAAAQQAPQVCYLWGAAGAGKTHLLQATVAMAIERGLAARYLDLAVAGSASSADPRPEGTPEPSPTQPGPPPLATGESLDVLALDHVDRAGTSAQSLAFTLYNATRDRGGAVVAAGRVPAIALSVRDDLRSRLGWGVAYEVQPLEDAEKRRALAEAAAGRGVAFGDDVLAWLLHHGPRDLRSLLAAVADIDRYSLARHRPVTVPLVREWLGEARPWG